MQNNDTTTRQQNKALFPLGQIFMTIGAKEAFKQSGQEAFEFLFLHQTGNWGNLCEEDKQENDFSVKEGFRILSAYHTNTGVKIWIVTEADRSVTTCLLPSEY